MMESGIAATLQVAATLDELGVEYFIGGALAGIVHGVVRTTQDADLVADLGAYHVNRFSRRLEGDFYLDCDAILDAVSRRSCFNIIHLASMFKVDIYLRRERPFDNSQFARRIRGDLSGTGGPTVFIASAEDTILAKLEWFRLGQEVSDRQWADVVGILRAGQAALDIGYMRRWAITLGVSDLLERVLETAGR